jgi:hypothetical protein
MGMHRYAALMRRAIVSAVVPTGCLGGCQIVKFPMSGEKHRSQRPVRGSFARRAPNRISSCRTVTYMYLPGIHASFSSDS